MSKMKNDRLHITMFRISKTYHRTEYNKESDSGIQNLFQIS